MIKRAPARRTNPPSPVCLREVHVSLPKVDGCCLDGVDAASEA
jgi:hypothetical protein